MNTAKKRPYCSNPELERIFANKYCYGNVELDETDKSWTAHIHKMTFHVFEGMISYAKKWLYTDKTREIDFCLLQASPLNAFAYASTDDERVPFDFICVLGGSVWTIYDLFNRVFSHPQILPHVGTASIEVEPEIDFLTTNVFASQRKGIMPKCPMRQIAAANMTQICISLLFAHELTHLQHGHLEWLRQNGKHSHLDESTTPVDKIALLRRQALEMDADAGAIWSVIDSTWRTELHLRQSGKQLKMEDAAVRQWAFRDFNRTISTVTFAVYMYFRNFDTPWSFEKAVDSTHPHPAIRMISAIVSSRCFSPFICQNHTTVRNL